MLFYVLPRAANYLSCLQTDISSAVLHSECFVIGSFNEPRCRRRRVCVCTLDKKETLAVKLMLSRFGGCCVSGGCLAVSQCTCLPMMKQLCYLCIC